MEEDKELQARKDGELPAPAQDIEKDPNQSGSRRGAATSVAVRPGATVLAVAGILATLAAWGIYFVHGLTAMIVGIIALILSIFGAVYVGKGCLRDLSITAAIASGVLIVVFVIFYWVLPGVIA